MKKALILALLVGSSSAAMADSSFSFQAHARIGTPMYTPTVRDHRSNTYYTNGQTRYFDNSRLPSDFNRVQLAYPSPVVINADCSNWDPNLDPASACDGYRSMERASMASSFGQWSVLATRESAVPDHQFVTVEKAFGQLRLDAMSGRPMFDRVAVRYMDGSTQVFNVGSRARSLTLRLDWTKAVSQVIVYTAAGSRGAYTISAS